MDLTIRIILKLRMTFFGNDYPQVKLQSVYLLTLGYKMKPKKGRISGFPSR